MMILALEFSSARGSAALLDNDSVVAEGQWIDAGRRRRAVFADLTNLMREAGVDWSSVDRIAVGRGPGNYSGMRFGLTVARALALPGGIPVCAVSSGEALALEIGREQPVQQVAVIGDARRDRVWFGVVSVAPNKTRLEQDWRLHELSEVDGLLPAGAAVVSPDWTRLADRLDIPTRADIRWVREDRCPKAGWVGLLAHERSREGIAFEPATPLYMHPPVFVPPRF